MNKIKAIFSTFLIMLVFSFSFAEEKSVSENKVEDTNIITTEKSDDSSSLKKTGKIIQPKRTNWSKIKDMFL